LTELYKFEPEMCLGARHDQLGSLAMDLIESICSAEIYAWGYGLRYEYAPTRQDLTKDENGRLKQSLK